MRIGPSETEVTESQPNNYFAQREVIKGVINYPPEQTTYYPANSKTETG